jgi:hypothetical protein
MQTTTNHRRPFTAHEFLIMLLILCASAAMPVQAQNHFPATIPFSSLTLGYKRSRRFPIPRRGNPRA